MPVPAPVTMATLPGPPSRGPWCSAGPGLLVICGKHDRRLSIGANVAAPHSARVERHHHVAVRVEADDASLAANRLELALHDRVGRRLNRHALVLHARADV